MPSSGPALRQRADVDARRPIERAELGDDLLGGGVAAARAAGRTRSRARSRDSSWAAMWWKAATTFASGRSAWASSADDPAGGGVKRRGPPNVSGTTVLITTLPRQASRTSGSVAASPCAGSARTTTVAEARRLRVATRR